MRGDGEFFQRAVDDKDSDQAERQVEPEDRGPVELGKRAAEERTGDAGDRPHAGNPGGVAAALARRQQVSDEDLREGEEAAAAETLHGTGADQDEDVRGERGDQRAEEEQPERGIERRPPPVDVGNAAVERRDRGCGKQVGGDDPGQILRVAEVAADGRHRRRDDRLVERGEEHRRQDADHRDRAVAIGKRGA